MYSKVLDKVMGTARIFAIVSCGLTLSHCSPTKPPTDFLDEDLTGKIAGKEWTYTYGFIDPTIDTPEEEDMVIVLLPFQPKGRCPKESVTGDDGRLVMVSVPIEKKLIKLKSGSNRNAVFQYSKSGRQAAMAVRRGKIKIDSIGDDKIVGRLYALHNNTNWVSGKFSAQICEYADFQ